jgi:hypothetical protein
MPFNGSDSDMKDQTSTIGFKAVSGKKKKKKI